MWRCELPGGIYEVALRSIISVSSHEYIVDGAARVTEVNVDTNGSMVVRFYLLEPITPTSPGPRRYGFPAIVNSIVPSRISIISSRRCWCGG